MRIRIHTHCLAMTLLFLSFTPPALAQSVLPSNLDVMSEYQELLESMADQSPTFRRQLLRVGAEDGLTIHIAVVVRIIGARAMTRMVRQDDGLTAHVEVARFENLVELIAHEIEHIIEQIEGLDLATEAAHRDSGVYSVGRSGNVFETERATRVGISVAQEIRDSARRELTIGL